MANRFIEVLARSYGRDSTMEKRGPQWVQLVKGYRWRRLRGSKISRRHSGQVARSGMIIAVLPPPVSLGRISKPAQPVGSSHQDSRLWMKLRGGFSAWRRSRNCSRPAREPSTSMKTPWLELLTHPARPSSAARRCTNGRKPTPWTAPRTAIFKRVFGGAFKPFIEKNDKARFAQNNSAIPKCPPKTAYWAARPPHPYPKKCRLETCRSAGDRFVQSSRLATSSDHCESGAVARALQDLSAHRAPGLHAKRLGVRNAVPLWDETGHRCLTHSFLGKDEAAAPRYQGREELCPAPTCK